MDRADEHHANWPSPLTLAFETSPELSAVRAEMRAWLCAVLPTPSVDEVVLASGEALANAIEHGRPPVVVDLRWSATTLHVWVKDSGTWKIPADTSARGLGMPIMTALMDSFTVDTADGTAITLSRRFPT